MYSRLRQFYLPALLVCSALGAAQKGPTSFIDGSWTLNTAKSEAGERRLPASLTIKVTTNGVEFEGIQIADGIETLLKFRSDGKEMVNQFPGGIEVRSKHRVENGAVIADYRFVMPQGGEITQTDRIVISADGKTLITDREVRTPQGNFKQKLVLDRQ